MSTTWRVDTLCGELFDANHGKPSVALAAIGRSLDMRPDDAKLAANVADERARDPENAAREFDCVAGVAGSTKMFHPASGDACQVKGRPQIVAAPPPARIRGGG